jgi:hypothetical protein
VQHGPPVHRHLAGRPHGAPRDHSQPRGGSDHLRQAAARVDYRYVTRQSVFNVMSLSRESGSRSTLDVKSFRFQIRRRLAFSRSTWTPVAADLEICLRQNALPAQVAR